MKIGQSEGNQSLLAIYFCSYIIDLSLHDEHPKRLVVYSLAIADITSFPLDILLNSLEDSSLRRDVLEAVQL